MPSYQYNRRQRLVREIQNTKVAYAVGDVIGGRMVFNVTGAGTGGILRNFVLNDADAKDTPVTIKVFSGAKKEFPDIADNDPFTGNFDRSLERKLVDEIVIGAGFYKAVDLHTQAVMKNQDVDIEFEASYLTFYVVADAIVTFDTAKALYMSSLAWID